MPDFLDTATGLKEIEVRDGVMRGYCAYRESLLEICANCPGFNSECGRVCVISSQMILPAGYSVRRHSAGVVHGD